MGSTDELSRVFSALASPTRRSILDRLAGASVTAGDLAAPYAMSGAAVSQHLAVLERAGLVTRTPRAQWREVTLRPAALDGAAVWVERLRQDWLQRFDRLDQRIAEINADRARAEEEPGMDKKEKADE